MSRPFATTVGLALTLATAASTLPAAVVLDNFDDGSISDWYVSSGVNVLRPRTTDSPTGGWGLRTQGNDGSPDIAPNMNSISEDDFLGAAFSPVFTVNNASASLSFNIIGGNKPFNEGSYTNGGAGVALWDVAARDFVRDAGVVRFVTRGSDSNTYTPSSIALTGLGGKEVSLVLIDRQQGGWGHSGIDEVEAPTGAITLSAVTPSIVQQWDFDAPGLPSGWTGDTTQFKVDSNDPGSSSRFVDLTNDFDFDSDGIDDQGFLISYVGADSALGSLRSPTFTLTGDLVEFRISGNATSSNARFELVRASDNVVLKTANSPSDSTQFFWGYWLVNDIATTENVYFRLVDASTGSFGYVALDALRVIDFTSTETVVPEPASLALLAIGGLLITGRRRMA